MEIVVLKVHVHVICMKFNMKCYLLKYIHNTAEHEKSRNYMTLGYLLTCVLDITTVLVFLLIRSPAVEDVDTWHRECLMIVCTTL